MSAASGPWLQLRPSLRSFALPGEAIVLLSDRQSHVLEGQVFVDLLPPLQTGATQEEIVERLAGLHAPTLCYYAIGVLESRGLLSQTPTSPDALHAFWDELGLDGPTVEKLAKTTVHISAFASNAGPALRDAIERAGFALCEDAEAADINVIACDDYVRSEVADLTRRIAGRGGVVLLVRCAGIVLWVGPLLDGRSCYDCLAWRLSTNDIIVPFVARRLQIEPADVRSPLAAAPIGEALISGLVPLHLARWVAGPTTDEPHVVTLALPTLEMTRHAVRRRPQCAHCGDPLLYSRQVTVRPEFHAPSIWNGADVDRLVSPVTGIVTNVAPSETGVPWLHSATAYFGFGGVPRDMEGLRSRLLSQASGVGATSSQARASAVYEAAERYSGMAHGDEPTISARFIDLAPESVVHPSTCMLYSDDQYAQRHATNALREHFNKVPAPFDPAAQIDWTGVWSLTASRFRLLPTCYLYYGHPDEVGAQYCWADSNGCAAGASLADATVRGLYELIERDSVAIWWYNRLVRPRVDLKSFKVTYFESFVEGYRSVDRDVWVLDITSDLGVPSFAAVSRDIAHKSEDILLTFGAHLDTERAVAHALMEMNHLLPAVLPANRDSFGDYPYPDPAQKRWWSQALVADHPYVAPDPNVAALTRDSFPAYRPLDSMDELAQLRLILEGRGLEVLMLDQSRPDIGVPVVKTMVPGLRHFWKRLAPGRLYDVPVSMRWLAVALDEDALNPIAMFV